MSRTVISTQEVRRTITELTQLSCEVKNKIGDLLEQQQTLSSQWKGDASDAFASAFQRDHAQWIRFAQVLDSYIETLQNICNSYEQAEQRNLEIISSRFGRNPVQSPSPFSGISSIKFPNTPLVMYGAPPMLDPKKLFSSIAQMKNGE